MARSRVKMVARQNGRIPVAVVETPPTETKRRVMWVDAEWDKLAEIVFHMRMSNTVDTVWDLANNAMSQFPENRRRVLNRVLCGPLTDRLSVKFARLQQDAEDSVANKMAADALRGKTDKEALLAELTDGEIRVRYGARLLDLYTPDELLNLVPNELILETIPLPTLAAETVRRYLESLSQPNEPVAVHVKSHHRPRQLTVHKKERLPKVAVCGCLPGQQQILKDALGEICDFSFYGNSENPQPGADFYVCWVRFVRHAVSDACKRYAKEGRYVQAVGGLTNIIERVREAVIAGWGYMTDIEHG